MRERFTPGSGERDEFMKEIEITSFNQFLQEQNISPESPEAEAAKKAWNAAVQAACEYFGNQEGTDHGAMDALKVS